jgi:hypothetical protein
MRGPARGLPWKHHHDHQEDPVKRNLTCPCGEHITGTDEDDLVEKVQQHLKDKHPSHDYSRDEILFMAY